MRYLLTSLLCVLTLYVTAQLPNGSVAPDFTATDITGVEYNLYDLLEEGNTVILDFEFTWCPPCWSYQQTGILEDIYNAFGPQGTGNLYVFLLESDDSTTEADLYGTGPSTTGDWVTGTSFPIFDNMGDVFQLYQNTYAPSIYTVCPDGTPNATTGEMEYTLVESGQASFDGHFAAAFMDCSNPIASVAPLMTYNGETSSCGGGEWMASTYVSNVGVDEITAMTFAVELNSVAQSSIAWTGVLSNGGSETVDLGSYSDVGTFVYTLTSVNGSSWNSEEMVDIVGPVESSNIIQVRITTDSYPEETGWTIESASGVYIDGVATGELAGLPSTEYTWDVALDLNECYIFTMTDSYGDGLNVSQWGESADGSFSVVYMIGENEVGTIVSYNGATDGDFAELAIGIETIEYVFSGCTDSTACNYFNYATEDDGSCVFPELGYDCDGQVVCFDIFISEYVEGSGNNRAVEFFNPTSESIDLSAYELQRWRNGAFTVTDATQLFGTLPPLSTWVLVNGQTEDVDLDGGGISPACDPELQALADQLDNPYPAPTFMNGNDALVLVKNGTTVIDIFGKPGEDPGVAWTDDAVNGFTDVGDGADWLTSNHTLRRKFDVVQGITVIPMVFDTFLEWDTLGLDTWDGLGFHNCFCGDSQSEIEGCTDINACNYNSTALINDGSCVFPEQWYDCLGECISDVDNDAICDQLEIIGCTDYEAYNFNSEATDSDNTLCIYFVPDCNSFGDPGWLDTESGTYPGQTSGIFGEIYNEDIAVHLSNTIVEPGSGVSYALDYFDFTSMSGLPQGLISTMTGGPMNPNSEVCVNVSGIPIETGVFDILFTGEAYINVFGISTYAGVLSFTHTLEIGDNPNPISGCTYPGSDNYLVYAMVDDGSCIISGCTDPEASNFHAIFNFEDGSCQYVEDISDCIEDINQDGTIGTPDLLQLLSAYGQVCD